MRSAWFLPLLAAVQCSENVPVGYDTPPIANAGKTGGTTAAQGGVGFIGGNGGAGGVGGGNATAGGACQVTDCQGKSYHCGNCIDDDADGLVDAQDPECLGPCDNSEDSYFGNIPGQNNAPCRQDCYFDRDSGSGNDGCDWSHACDSLSLAPNFPPSGRAECVYDAASALTGRSCVDMAATQPAECIDTCLALTPNGCDCFGCCELPAKSGKFVWLGSETDNAGSCDAEHVSDPAACKPCTPVSSCFNPCEACEVCVGTTAPGPSCTSNPGPTCDVGIAACGPGARCAAGEYCITGCCIAAPR